MGINKILSNIRSSIHNRAISKATRNGIYDNTSKQVARSIAKPEKIKGVGEITDTTSKTMSKSIANNSYRDSSIGSSGSIGSYDNLGNSVINRNPITNIADSSVGATGSMGGYDRLGNKNGLLNKYSKKAMIAGTAGAAGVVGYNTLNDDEYNYKRY